jgi:2-keto-4-pentenoate hydratase/2-oxohepta-3-ene-1,7-dioic acid hydratase in catechol pathway
MKIICIGRNYAQHAKELGNEAPKEPVFFLKPDSAVLPAKTPFFYPAFTNDIHYELEVVVKICKLGKHIAPKFASTYYKEIGLGIDFTARDVQAQCKEKGLPWEKAKAFDGSAVLGRFLPKEKLGNLQQLDFRLEQNNKVVQTGNTAQMLFPIDEIIAYVSQFMTLKIGDLIFTGTPAGVGPIKIKDELEGYLGDQKLLSVAIR